ncbi:hypothetical protein ACFLIM_48445 [Nonomuraea sp. M3C6]|uniref:Uncharacterized protein n=1 Tax=Nonomuraea marmarensis TaxID=3351344 RepID=A0ABW7AUF4_9ACTN
MEAELMALAGSAATTLVGLMISDSWAHTKDKLARFFARSGAEDEIAKTLDTARAELVAARETGDAPTHVPQMCSEKSTQICGLSCGNACGHADAACH